MTSRIIIQVLLDLVCCLHNLCLGPHRSFHFFLYPKPALTFIFTSLRSTRGQMGRLAARSRICFEFVVLNVVIDGSLTVCYKFHSQEKQTLRPESAFLFLIS